MNSGIPVTANGKIGKLTSPEEFKTVAEEIYGLMNGSYVFPSLPKEDSSANGYYNSPLAYKIANETESGKSAELLDKIWNSRMRIKEKMGIVVGDDDDDILQIIESYEDLNLLYIRKVLEYGYRIGSGEW